MTDGFIPATPDPSYVEIAAGMIRGLLQILSSFGFTWALTVSGSQVTMAATAFVMLATLLWSAWNKITHARAVNLAAVASASQGRPVEPTPPPPVP